LGNPIDNLIEVGPCIPPQLIMQKEERCTPLRDDIFGKVREIVADYSGVI
jgi:hypothetical protein